MSDIDTTYLSMAHIAAYNPIRGDSDETKKEYLSKPKKYLRTSGRNQKKFESSEVRKVGDIYGNDLPKTVQRIISNSEESVFFDDNSRMLAFEEILDAEQDLHVDFREKGMLPLADCGENDFIVYHMKDKLWSVFNIVDEAIFRKKNNFEELMS